MKTVTCPGCGAPATVAMLRAGECGYCHAALVKPPPPPEAPRPVVNIHVQGPTLDVDSASQVVGAVGTRAVGCVSGCITTGFTFAFMALIFAYVAFQIRASMPPPPPAPHVAPAPHAAPVAPHPKGRKGR